MRGFGFLLLLAAQLFVAVWAVVAAAAATNKLKLCMLRHRAMGICFVGKPLLSLA